MTVSWTLRYLTVLNIRMSPISRSSWLLLSRSYVQCNVLRQSFHIAVLPLLSKFKLFLVVHKNNKNAEERHWPIPFTLSGPAAGIIETEKRITEMSSSPTKGPLLSQASGWLAFFQTVYFKNKRHRGKDIRRDIFNHRRWRINTLDFTFFVFGILAQEVSFVQLGFVKTSLRDRK